MSDKKLSVVARLLSEPSIKSAIATTKAALARSAVFQIEHADDLHPDHAVARLKADLRATEDANVAAGILDEIAKRSNPGAVDCAHVTKAAGLKVQADAADAVTALLDEAARLVGEFHAESIAAETALAASYGMPRTETPVSRQFASAKAQLQALADWPQAARNQLLNAEGSPLKTFFGQNLV